MPVECVPLRGNSTVSCVGTRCSTLRLPKQHSSASRDRAPFSWDLRRDPANALRGIDFPRESSVRRREPQRANRPGKGGPELLKLHLPDEGSLWDRREASARRKEAAYPCGHVWGSRGGDSRGYRLDG